LKFEQVLLDSKDSQKIEMVSDAFNLMLDQKSKDPSTSLSLFFHYKNTYLDRFLIKQRDAIKNLFFECENKIKLPFHVFLPSSPIKTPDYVKRIYFFSFNLFIGIALFFSLHNKADIVCFLHIMVFNCLILCLVGFYQRINHQWTDNYVEILGIWDAPEPRYYFSTFTYKNHWSAYAIMILFCAFYLVRNEVIRLWKTSTNILHSKLFIYLTFSIIIIAFSILLSGSRSGIILLIFSFFICFYKVVKNKNKMFEINLKFLSIIFLFIPLLLLLFLSFKKDNKWEEMVRNSSSQWQNFVQGKPPLRILFWRDTMDMIQEKPFWGYGYNSFSSMYPKFQSTQVRNERALGLENAHTPYVPLVAHAHSDVLEFFAEWGLGGIFLIFFPFLFYLLKTFHIAVPHPSTITGWGCLVFLLYCWIDFPTRTPACLATFSALFALTMKIHSLRQEVGFRF
ncbi:MAG: O-antigen ligase family protein, partial [Opitutae bacterium]